MFLLGWFRARLLIFSALTLKTLIVQISQRAYERFLCLFLLPVFVKKMFQRQWPVWNSAVRKVGDKKHDDIQNSCRYELIIDRPNKTLSQLLFFLKYCNKAWYCTFLGSIKIFFLLCIWILMMLEGGTRCRGTSGLGIVVLPQKCWKLSRVPGTNWRNAGRCSESHRTCQQSIFLCYECAVTTCRCLCIDKGNMYRMF